MKRIYPKVLFGLLGFAGVITVSTYVLGFGETRGFFYLSWAAGAIVLGSLAWEFVERGLTRDAVDPGVKVWLAFPLAMLLWVGSLPLLVLAIYPSLEGTLKSSGRIEVYVESAAAGSRLVLIFPRATRQRGNDLAVNAQAVPLELTEGENRALTWKGPRELWVDLTRLPESLRQVEKISVNLLTGRRGFAYDNGDTVSAQVLPVTTTE